MSRTITSQLLLIAAAAAAVALAPTAGADTEPGCATALTCSDASPAYSPPESDFTRNIPQGWTNETQFLQPGYNPFGAGPQPPLLALE
jgi:hypothetical protein